MSRMVGVEVEYIGDVPAVIDALRAAGLSSRNSISSYMGHSSDEWITKRDASVSARGEYNYPDPRANFSGGELVSPPMDFDDPTTREAITKAVMVLQTTGAYPNDSAGIHVHVECRDLSVKQIAAVVKNFYKFQDVIYRLASSGHRTMRSGAASYAPPIGEARVRRIAAARTMQELQLAYTGDRHYNPRNHGDSSRYCGINLHSYFYRGTIEFRVFNSSVNPERVQAYVAMCVALVEDARRGKSRSINKVYALGGMQSGATNEKNAYHRFAQVLRYEAGMALEDMSRLTKMWNDSCPQMMYSNR